MFDWPALPNLSWCSALPSHGQRGGAQCSIASPAHRVLGLVTAVTRPEKMNTRRAMVIMLPTRTTRLPSTLSLETHTHDQAAYAVAQNTHARPGYRRGCRSKHTYLSLETHRQDIQTYRYTHRHSLTHNVRNGKATGESQTQRDTRLHQGAHE